MAESDLRSWLQALAEDKCVSVPTGQGELIRACAFALATAELAQRGRLSAEEALTVIASELDEALRLVGVDIGELARAFAAAPSLQDN